MTVADKISARRREITGRKSFAQPPFWSQDAARLPFLTTTTLQADREEIENDFVGYIRGAFKGNGIVFALILARQAVFSEARFQWRRFENGRPQDLFGTNELRLLERPWPGGTTGELLAHLEQDSSLAGNFFATTADNFGRLGRRAQGPTKRIVRMRPDWVTIVIDSASGNPWALDARVVAYLYQPMPVIRGPLGSPIPPDENTVLLTPAEVCHYSPNPDPEARFRGMSWLTPVLREIQADTQSTIHKEAFLKNGAPQPLDAKVLTPSGWATMGQMSVGGQVIGSDGKPHTVTGVYPQGKQDIYQVTFSDGSSTECTADHIWRVASPYDRKRGVSRTMSLQEIVDGGLGWGKDGRVLKWSVPLVDPVEYDSDTDLAVDPYLLGLLLGDGSFRSNGKGSGGITLACAASDTDETASEVVDLLPAGVSISRRDRGGWSELYFKGPGSPRPNPLTRAIRGLGLWDVGGRDKFIPAEYLTASVKDRVAVLQGLIDSDGSVDAHQPNLVTYTTTSDRLACDLVELVHGLGGLASMAKHGGRDRWRVVVKRLPDWITPCRLSRKVSRYSPDFLGGRWRYIKCVELVGRKQAQCIRVDAPDHLYVTDGFILTHNTPNIVVKFDKDTAEDAFEEFVEGFNASHKGAANAYKTLFLMGGADVSTIGTDFRQLDFSATVGKGESRLAAAAGVPPSWVGFSEALQGSSLNAGNFTAQRRRFADGTMRPLWRMAAASLQSLVTPPDDGAELWYDDRDIAFLREDQGDQADIQFRELSSITMAVREGFTHDSSIRAVTSGDLTLLEPQLDDAGEPLRSVQLQPPELVGADVPTTDGSEEE